MLKVNSPVFAVEEFPKPVLDIFRRGGSGPALVIMRRWYPRAIHGWCERAIEWLEEHNATSVAPLEQAKAEEVVKPRVGDKGYVLPKGKTPKPGAPILCVEALLSEGTALKVKDSRGGVHFILTEMFTPIDVIRR